MIYRVVLTLGMPQRKKKRKGNSMEMKKIGFSRDRHYTLSIKTEEFEKEAEEVDTDIPKDVRNTLDV